MKNPVKRKKTNPQCPININSLYRHWDRGDDRIDWSRIEKLYVAWQKGEKVPWRKLSPTFIKKGRRPARYHRPIPARALRPQARIRRTRQAEERNRLFWQTETPFETPTPLQTPDENPHAGAVVEQE